MIELTIHLDHLGMSGQELDCPCKTRGNKFQIHSFFYILQATLLVQILIASCLPFSPFNGSIYNFSCKLFMHTAFI